SDGQQALDYLRGEGQFADRSSHPHPPPDLLLLDLKMPRMDGFQVLDWLRRQPVLKRLPVVVFSSSPLDHDINRAYDLGASSFLVKPHENEKLNGLVEKLKSYWIEANARPDAFPA